MSKACQKHLNSVESTAVKNFFIGRVHSKWAKQKRRQESDGFTKSSRFLWNEPETHEIQQLETKLSLATSGKGCLRNQDWCHRVYRMKPFFFEARFLLILYHPRDVSLWQASELLTPLLIRYGHRANVSGFHSTNNVLCIYTIMQTAFLIFFFFFLATKQHSGCTKCISKKILYAADHQSCNCRCDQLLVHNKNQILDVKSWNQSKLYC